MCCETDDAKLVTAFVTKFSAWNDVSVVPVLDIQESIGIILESNQTTESALAAAFPSEAQEVEGALYFPAIASNQMIDRHRHRHRHLQPVVHA